jgi:hypothetical protein
VRFSNAAINTQSRLWNPESAAVRWKLSPGVPNATKATATAHREL